MTFLSSAFVAAAVAGIAAALAPPQGGMDPGEWGLRRAATTAPMPEYPRESLAAKATGVVVAAVRFGLDGTLETIDILQSPDAHTAGAVREAVGRWVVPPAQVMGREQKSPIQGKLTFYFQIRGGKGVVLDLDEMPGGAPRPKPRPAPASTPAGPPAGPPPSAPSVRTGGHGEVKTITVEEFKQHKPEAVVVDVGDRDAFTRGHWPGAINIPVDELRIRGGPELPRNTTIVIDCTQEQKFRCDAAAWFLTEQNFPSVLVLVR